MFKPTFVAWREHGEGLLSAFDESWKRRCVLSKHDAAPKLDLRNAFQASECCSLAFCKHQGDGQQAFFLHSSLIKFLKPLIRAIRQPRQKAGDTIDPSNAKKRNPIYPEARKLLDKGFAVLKLESVLPNREMLSMDAVCDAEEDESNPALKEFVRKRLASRHSQHDVPEKHWLHVGFMNHSSSTFTVLPLSCDTQGPKCDFVFPETADAYRSFEYFQHRLDFNKQWKFSLCRILCDDTVLAESEMVPGRAFPVGPMPSSQPAIFWKGKHAEENMRAAEAAAKAAADAKKRARKKRPKDTRPRRQLKLQDMFQQEFQGEAQRAAIQDMIQDVNDSCSDDGNDSDASSSDSQSQVNVETADDSLFAEVHQVAEGRDVAQDPPESEPDDDLPDFQVGDVDNALRAAAADLAPAPVHAEPAAGSREVPLGAEPKPAARAARRTHGPRNVENIAKISIPGHGELVYYMDLEAIQARCSDPGHGDCRRQRTTKAGARAGQGRPIGLLVSWLMQQSDFGSQHEHGHLCHPNLDQRREAREAFQQLEGADEFSSFERDKRRGEDDEPAQIT